MDSYYSLTTHEIRRRLYVRYKMQSHTDNPLDYYPEMGMEDIANVFETEYKKIALDELIAELVHAGILVSVAGTTEPRWYPTFAEPPFDNTLDDFVTAYNDRQREAYEQRKRDREQKQLNERKARLDLIRAGRRLS